MTAEVEVARNSVYLEIPFHSASLLVVYIFHDALQHLIVAHAFITVNLVVRQRYLLKVVLDIDMVHLQNVLDVQRQKRTGVSRKGNVDVHFQFLCQVLLIDDEVAIYFRSCEVNDRHDSQEQKD